MKQKYKLYFFSVVFVLLGIEFLVRLYMIINFNTPFFKPSNCIYKYYPELKKVSTYNYEKDKINILILGGSVVYEDSVKVYLPYDTINYNFCSFPKLLPRDKYNVLSLSNIAHNSLDSKYKYSLLLNSKFDYVLLYHGINDTRTNNIRSDKFRSDYSHIEFYDDLSVIYRHPKINFFTSIFVFDWIFHSFSKIFKHYIDKENFNNQFSFDNSDINFSYGNNILSKSTFKNNYLSIIKVATKKGEILITPTYAFYLDKGYTYLKFKNKELDYDQQLFPTELYGLPENVKKGIIVHNEVLEKIAEEYKENVVFFDFNSILPKNKLYFDDICHLNQSGCQALANAVIEAIKNNEYSNSSILIE